MVKCTFLVQAVKVELLIALSSGQNTKKAVLPNTFIDKLTQEVPSFIHFSLTH